MAGRLDLETFKINPEHPGTPAEIADSLAALLSGFSSRSFGLDNPVINQLQLWLNSFISGAAGFNQLQQVRAVLENRGLSVSWQLRGTPDRLRLDSMVIIQTPHR